MGIKTDETGPAYIASMAAPGLEVAVTPLIGKLQLHIQGYVGNEEFFIMPLEGCDVLLGLPWFYNHKAVLDSFNKTITLAIRGRKIVLDVKLKGESVPLVSASALPRLMKQHISAYLIYVKERDETESSNLSSLDVSRRAFLDEYADCFSEALPVTMPLVSSGKDLNTSGPEWKRKSLVTFALTILTSSQGILIAWSKRAGGYDYSVTSANFMVEVLKCLISVGALLQIWQREGVTEDNRLSMSWDEVKVYPIPAMLYLVKNILQYYIFLFVNAPSYQILKNLNIITTGVLYKIFLKRRLTSIQWAAYALLALGCTTAQLNSSSEHVLQTPFEGWTMAIVVIKKQPSRNINVQNFWLYIFGIVFNAFAIFTQDFDAVMNKGFFYGYTTITVCMITNHALSGIAVSMVMKYADNIVKVYSTSVAMLLTAVISMMLFNFKLTLPFVLGSLVVSIAVFLHSQGKATK
ncbi:hypothetical protein L7F22_053248 [Adiantum nelumboides]|nr:hypothetical protein [Adiantum nelumboides]